MATYHQLVERVIKESDIILMVLDCREAEQTVNEHLLERLVDKQVIFVINKIDLMPEDEWKTLKKRFKPSVAVSAKKHLGTMMLLRKINQIAKGGVVTVGVIGYPNTGKSSVINAMRGRGSASVSPVAGHTKALQRIRVSKNILLIDSPGVIAREDGKDQTKQEALSFIGTIDAHKIKDPDMMIMKIMIANQGVIEKYYGVPVREDFELTLETIAIKKHCYLHGKQPDTMRMARKILEEYQRGLIT